MRCAGSNVLVQKYTELVESGWQVTEAELARDVEKLFGGSFETFCDKDTSQLNWASNVVTLSNLGK